MQWLLGNLQEIVEHLFKFIHRSSTSRLVKQTLLRSHHGFWPDVWVHWIINAAFDDYRLVLPLSNIDLQDQDQNQNHSHI